MSNHSLKVRCVYPFQDSIPDFYQTKRINAKYVADGLRDEIDQWIPQDPVMIDSPTGSGKNTFIIEECIPRALQAGKNILLISNRVALSTQQKLIIMEKIKSPKLGKLTDQGILEEEDFGNVKVITYHRLRAFLDDPANDQWRQNLMFVILDECHFFMSDSLFNEMCGFYLNKIVSKFSKAIRIYLTATSWDVLHPIAEAEQSKYLELVKPNYWRSPRVCIRYYFPRHFERYHLDFIKSIEDLVYLIGTKQNEKWLIFIDNKEKGKELAEELDVPNTYLDSESKGSATWKQIVNKGSFEKQVLITTSVLDNGVNIVDNQLKNIVIFTDNRTSLIQMLGRKRCTEAESVNLWVYDIPLAKAQRLYHDCESLYSWFEEYDACYDEQSFSKLANKIWYSEDNRLRILFGLSKGHLFENRMARFHIQRKKEFFKQIVEGKTTFQNSVQQWLDKPQENPASYYEKVLDFCSSHLGKHLTEGECKALRFLIVNASEEAGNKESQRSRIGELKDRALNNRLASLDIGYQIDCINQEWILSKRNEEADFDLQILSAQTV